MEYIQWSDSLSVYNNFVDSQHRDLVERINELYQTSQQPDSMDSAVGLLAEMVKAMRTHFNTEEVLMQATEYPGIHIHRREHNDHMVELEGAQNRVNSTGEFSGDLFLTLRAIVVDHMQTTDMDFGTYLQKFMAEHPDAPLPFSDTDQTEDANGE